MEREKSNNFSGVHKGRLSEQSKNITLKVNSELYDRFRELCKKEGWIVSRQFEKCMEAELKRRGRGPSLVTFFREHLSRFWKRWEEVAMKGRFFPELRKR